MFDTIVCPIDGSPASRRALSPAADLAHRFRARLVILISAQDVSSREAKEVLEHAVAESAAARTSWPRGAIDAERAIETEHVIDTEHKPVDAIEAVVSERAPALVCMSTHGRRGLARQVIGSTAEATVRRLDTPILLLGPAWDGEPDPGAGGLVVALDGSESGETIIPVALRWAAACDVPVTFVEVLDGTTAAGSDRESYVDDQVRLARRHHADTTGRVLRDPDPAAGLVDYVDREDLLLVAMATRAYRGLARLTAGSVTMDVVRSCRHPVLVVTP